MIYCQQIHGMQTFQWFIVVKYAKLFADGSVTSIMRVFLWNNNLIYYLTVIFINCQHLFAIIYDNKLKCQGSTSSAGSIEIRKAIERSLDNR